MKTALEAQIDVAYEAAKQVHLEVCSYVPFDKSGDTSGNFQGSTPKLYITVVVYGNSVLLQVVSYIADFEIYQGFQVNKPGTLEPKDSMELATEILKTLALRSNYLRELFVKHKVI